jgi:rhodanese-related sulfurtransferase
VWQIAFLILLINALVLPALIVSVSAYTSVDVATAYSMITGGGYPDLLILDVRSKGEYDSGHIYGATLIPVAELSTRIGELAGHLNDPILVYCASGGRSKTASGILDSNNFTQVYNMLGGLTAWRSAGYPTYNATVHNVDTTYNYDTIQAAIDSALTMNGNTISVDNGTYHEHVIISKTLSIIGEDSLGTVIDGKGTATTILITANNVTVENFTVQNGTRFGVHLNGGNYTQIRNNKLVHNYCGINVSSSYNMIFGNEIANSTDIGMLITQGDNTIFENNITDNNRSVCVDSPQTLSGNLIYHNNFSNNTYRASTNVASGLWDNGYPSGGNYWSDYNGTDLFSGPYQNLAGGDGLGDTPYTIDANNVDHYPLIRPWLWGPRSLTIISTEGGTTSPAPGDYVYNTTAYVQVAAIAYSNYTFDHWEFDGYTINGTDQVSIRTDTSHTLKAVFAHLEYTLEITFTAGGNTDPPAGNYTFKYGSQVLVNASSDIGYYLDRWELDSIYVGIFNPASVTMNENHTLHAVFKQLDAGHNIAAKWITSKTVVGQGFNLSIRVTVVNTGSFTEDFNVTAYLNSTSVMQENVTLNSGASTTLTFTVNTSGFSRGNYTISAIADTVPNETDTADNVLADGIVLVSFPGDTNGDGKVRIDDVLAVASRFGTNYGGPPNSNGWSYDANCDITDDGKIRIDDVLATAQHFGQGP